MKIQSSNLSTIDSSMKKVRVSIKKQEQETKTHVCGLKELKESVVNLTITVSKLRAEQHEILQTIKNSNCHSINNVNSTNQWSDPNIKPQFNKLNYEQLSLIKTGKYPVLNKIRLIYFKGLRKGKFLNVKLLLFSVGIKAYQIINISFVGKQIFELITRDQYVEHIIVSLHSLEILILPKFNPCLLNDYENGTTLATDENTLKLSLEKFKERIQKGLDNKSRDHSKMPKIIFEQLLQCDHISINNYLLSTYENLNNLIFNESISDSSTIQ